MSINKVDSQSRFNYAAADKHPVGVVKGKGKNEKAPKKSNLPVSENDPDYSDNTQIKARNKKLEGVIHYDDGIQKESKLKARKESLEGVHYDDHIQKKVKSQSRHDNREDTAHYHDLIQEEARRDAKGAINKGKARSSKEKRRNKKAQAEFEQHSKDTEHDPKGDVHLEFEEEKQTDEAQQSGTVAQATKSLETTKSGLKKVLTIDAHLKIAEDGSSYLHATTNDPSIEEIYRTTKLSASDIKSLDSTMKKFFLSPLKRDMTLRVMTLYLNSLAKEFLAQLDYDIVQTKLKVSSIMSQKDELMDQAVTKLIGGISESMVTATAASLSIGSAASGLHNLNKGTKATKEGMKETDEAIESADKGLASTKDKLRGLRQKKADLDAKNTSKETDEYKEIEKSITETEGAVNEQTSIKTKLEKERGAYEEDQRKLLRKIDLKVAKLNGFSQLIGSGKGFINGITDYFVTMNQANIKLQDAIQAQLQLTKDNARMFMQKSNEYITSLLSSLLSIINSIYQARRGIITS